ncbi:MULTISPECIES: cupin domain-containing protein [Rhodomicrobium]|uniref:cupin domain-containing protein n=1 Tax=Rhodomicrobium TaxID=1068 RepID=UPI000B4AD734|nr:MULTISPECIES: cupin domain-containing protein [Rhodomicrobium]
MERDKHFREAGGDFRWDGVDVHAYKDDGSAPFKDITRQTLFNSDTMAAELRYFEVAPGGYSTLERHEHVHAVMILRGKGRCLVGDEVREIGHLDLVSIPPMHWHQFRAAPDEPLGFLCMVDRQRDRPQLPDARDFAELRSNPDIAAFLGEE